MVDFFKVHIAADNRAVENMLNKIDYFEEQEGVLSKIANVIGEDATFTDKNKYFLFCKCPQVPSYKRTKEEIAALGLSKEDKKMRVHILKLLTDAETLECLKTSISDPKSLSVNL
jgi:hypothetical protein